MQQHHILDKFCMKILLKVQVYLRRLVSQKLTNQNQNYLYTKLVLEI